MSVIRAEDIPLYHVCPGGLVLRLVTPSTIIIRCKGCWWDTILASKNIIVREANAETIMTKIKLIRPAVVMLDGIEPLSNEWAIDLLREIKRLWQGFVVIKTIGLCDSNYLREAIRNADGIVLEYLVPVKPELAANRELHRNLEEVKGFAEKIPVELHIPYDGSKRADVVVSELSNEFANLAAIHIIPLSDVAYENAYKLIERLYEDTVFLYLYKDESFIYTDTKCPYCGAPLVKRKPWGISIDVDIGPEGIPSCRNCHKKLTMLRICKIKHVHSIHRELVIW